MPIMTGGERKAARLVEWERRQAKERANRDAELERARKTEERLFAEVEADMLAAREAAEAEARLTPEERQERRLAALEQERAQGVMSVIVRQPERPRGYWCAREAIERKWREEEAGRAA